MNCALTKATSGELDICSVYIQQHAASSAKSNEYVTAPLAEVLPLDQPANEEETYNAFEEAISERSGALHSWLNRYSHPTLDAEDRYTSEPMSYYRTTEEDLATSKPCHTLSRWQRLVILVSIPLNFLLAGFDLMGMLVLHTAHLH